MPGWNAFFTFPKDKKGYSGVVIYIREAVCVPFLAEEGITGWLPHHTNNADGAYRSKPDAIGGYPTDISQAEGKVLDSEGRAVVLDLGLFVLIGTYCPAVTEQGREDYRMQWLEVLGERVRNLNKMGRRVVVVGDINICRDVIDTADPKEAIRRTGTDDFKATKARKWLDSMLEPQRDDGVVLHDLCREYHPNRQGMYTCWSTRINARPGNYGSRVDYCFCTTSMREWVTHADIQSSVMGSDHCPLFLDLANCLRGVYLLDKINAPGVFVEGEKVGTMPLPPKLCARYLSEFSSRQSVISMLSIGKDALPSKETTPRLPKSEIPTSSILNPPPSKKRRKDAARSQTLLSNFVSSAKPAMSSRTTITNRDIIDPADEALIEALLREEQEAPQPSVVDSSSWNKLFTKPNAPLCEKHMEPCIELVTKKPGPNNGRHFWICSRSVAS